MAIVDRVRELVAPIIEDEEVELYDIEHNGGVLRIFVDHPDGIDIDVIKRISRSVGHELDEADPIPGRYTLEVSSPGLERPLRTPDHFRRALGSTVKMKTLPHVDGDRRVEGELSAVDDDGVEITADGVSRRVAFDDISKARTVFEWGPTPKPGGKHASAKKSSAEKIPE
jgi:ribosome maturation factor RimP